ncbi:hypothetical protein [Edaphobacter modestus]|uniref:Ribbon-helix-helix CopG family protein n=1 Tax=Edaphobacter modestus TaxID=388466 RepID=A0A4Q7YW79_9BACT|nr:hypothetical protein [Edaphobacter modestus]RZU41343.1 hypothetical protein BDD14_2860 [Edaphobacter modestus]
MAKKQQVVTIRCEHAFIQAIQKAAKAEGYASPSSYIRQACVNSLNGVSRALSEAEERILATLERQSRDLHKLQTVALVQYAAFDTFVKLFMTYTPEMPLEVKEAAIALAKARYTKFRKDVAQEMTGRVSEALREIAETYDGLGSTR